MITTKQARNILNDPKLSDSQVEMTRDEFRLLSEVIFEQWQKNKTKRKGFSTGGSLPKRKNKL